MVIGGFVGYYRKSVKNTHIMSQEVFEKMQEREKELEAVKDDWGAYMAVLRRHRKEDEEERFYRNCSDWGFSAEEAKTVSVEMREAIMELIAEVEQKQHFLDEIEHWLDSRPY